VIGRVVASAGAVRPEEVEGCGRAREEVPPDWRERDMMMMVRMRRWWWRFAMVENWWYCCALITISFGYHCQSFEIEAERNRRILKCQYIF